MWDELLVGLKALLLNRTMGTLTVIFTVVMLGIGAFNVLWVIFLKTRFGLRCLSWPGASAVIDIVFGAGMILASVVVGNFLANVAPKWYIVFALIGVGVGLIVFVIINDYWVFASGQRAAGHFRRAGRVRAWQRLCRLSCPITS